MKTKTFIFNELKQVVRKNLLCGNAYYFIVFNHNEEEDYMVIDEYAINTIGKKELVAQLKERRKEITKVTYWDAAPYKHEDELLYEKSAGKNQ